MASWVLVAVRLTTAWPCNVLNEELLVTRLQQSLQLSYRRMQKVSKRLPYGRLWKFRLKAPRSSAQLSWKGHGLWRLCKAGHQEPFLSVLSRASRYEVKAAKDGPEDL